MSKFLSGLFFLTGALCCSCIRDELPNSECDIEQAVCNVADAAVLFDNEADTLQDVISASNKITFYTRMKDATNEEEMEEQLKNVRVYFKITEGATISPANGSMHDFSKEATVTYTLTSENKQWQRIYQVRFLPRPSLRTDLHFEDFELESGGKYYDWFEMDAQGGRINQWATGNPGFKISRSSATKEEYPTIPWSEEESISGHAVKLETRDTGPFGAMVNMRIAAGNLFIGTFDVTNALKDAMAATHFGLPFNKKPLRLKGYYRYMHGEAFQNRGGAIIEGRIDEPDIYGVLYKNTLDDGTPMVLQGDNVLTHKNIVALARIQNPIHDRTWHEFDLEFEYNEDIDYELLHRNGYNLAVVFTSSIKGAEFEGAVGSTLLVDEVEIVCEEE